MFEISHTSNLLIRKKSDVVEFFIWGKDFFGGGRFCGGRYRGFFRGEGKVLGGKVQSPESRVQSPESRVQSPGSSPAFRICQINSIRDYSSACPLIE